MKGYAATTIKPTNGILQGDPLSPLIFVMAMTALHLAIDAECANATPVSSVDDFLALVPVFPCSEQ